MIATKNAGRVLGMALMMAAWAGCDAPPEQAERGGQLSEVAVSQAAASVCNDLGIPDPGTCSTCSQSSSGNWTQLCVTIECSLVWRSCAAPIVSCGQCGYRWPRGFVQLCTRADGSQTWQSCQPPRLPPPPGGFPALPVR